MSNDINAVDVVRNVIQRVYGDATQTVLDAQAAREIVAALREMGWASLEEVAVLIEAAGGSVTVPDSLMLDTRERRIMRSDDYASRGRRFSVSVAPRT